MSTVAVQRLPLGGRGTGATGWWGMMLLIATEATLFVYLLFSYFYLGSMARGWPPHGPPELRLALPNTVVLLLSSGTMWYGDSGARRDNQQRLRIGLVLTILLGCAFLAVQLVEYSRQRFTPATDAYGSLFFTITGFHGAHVLVGLLMLAFVTVRAFLGHFSARRRLAITNVGWYWHFVDVVWLAVFTSLYLSPRLLVGP